MNSVPMSCGPVSPMWAMRKDGVAMAADHCVVWCGVVLCCVVLCYVVLCCVVLCCVVLWCVVLCCVVLCCAEGAVTKGQKAGMSTHGYR